jgi:carboxyl-terminal processing protease
MKQTLENVMKKLFLFMILLVTAGLFSAKSVEHSFFEPTSDSVKVVAPQSYHKNETNLINTIVSRYHYRKFQLNDSLSSVIYSRYLKSLDNNKLYFLESDIDDFARYTYRFDDYLLEGNLEPAYELFRVYRDRVNERIDFIESLLENEFDFSIDEYFEPNRKNADWPVSQEEINELWRKRIKNDALNLKLTGKEWESIAETLTKRYENYRKAINRYNSEDVFQLFINSYTETVDPHTNYLSPLTSDNFKINMSLSLEGIGAQLQNEDDYTKVADIVPGGPASKSNLLHRNDRIIGVGQDDDGEMVDVIGWRVTDVVQLIRGPKGTTVRLLLLKADDGINAAPIEIKLVRDKVKLEEQSAKKEVIDINHDNIPYKIGVISIPTFYSDFEAMQRGERDYKSTTRDVRKILGELKAEKVDGVIIDLRNNGGGSLNEAIDLTGLFIKEGPVVQVRHSDGSIKPGYDPDSKIVYDGHLTVLVNRFSASASEIFAAAIQDYNRGIIVGEQTFGKGTVQNLIDLNRLMPGQKDKFGQVKVTVAKYYRINGGSTQSLGVIPDINFPSSIDPEEFGESSEPSALPWDQIQPARYNPIGDISKYIPELKRRHNKRADSDPEFDYLMEDIKEAIHRKEQKLVSLNEEVRRKEKEKSEEQKFQRENERRKVKGIKLLDKGEKSEDSSAPDDLYLEESARVLADLINITVG